MADQVRVNGKLLSWSSTKLKIQGEPYAGISSISFDDALELAKFYGLGRHHAPQGHSAGKYTPENLKLRARKATGQQIREDLARLSPSGNSYGTPVVSIVLQFLEADDTQITIEFGGCRYVKTTESNEEGADALTEEIEFSVLEIRRNGLVLWDDSEA